VIFEAEKWDVTPSNRCRSVSEKDDNSSSERSVVDEDKRALVKKAVYAPPAIATVYLMSSLLGPAPRDRGSGPPDPPVGPDDPMLSVLFKRLRLKR
jgi:hypothetical protein